jgi:hypothetical protein
MADSLRAHQALAHQVDQALLQGLHADRGAGLDRRVHLRHLVLADQVADRRGADHDLVRGDAPAADLFHQRLRDHRAQRLGQHRADHVLLGRREDVDDAVDGLGRGDRVQGAEHQVAGLGRGQGQADGLQVAHLADQDDVGILAQGRAQRLVEAEGVTVHLALVDDRLLRLVHELDRVLDGEDVAELLVVDVVDHRRQGGRLAGTGRTGDQAQAAWDAGDVLELGRAVELLQGQHLGRDGTEHRAGAAVLVEGVDPEAGHAGQLEGEVGLEELLVVLALLVVHDVVDEGMDVLVLHRRQVDPLDVAVDADHRWQAGREMQVGSTVLLGERQEFRDVHSLTPLCYFSPEVRLRASS